MIPAQVKAGARAVMDGAVEKRIVVPAHKNPGLARLNRIAAMLNLAKIVQAREMRDIGKTAIFHHAIGGIFKAHRGGADAQALEVDVFAPAKIERSEEKKSEIQSL